MMESKCVFRMLAVVCGAAVLMLSCSENEQETARRLEEVASFVEERPDSAMVILDTMGRERLKTKSLRASHALLLAMARDKNRIDDVTDSVIAPAVSWYRRHGSADERLLMNYYRGRIAMNAGDYEAAMEWFVKAERCGKSSHDMMCLGRLRGAKSAVYNHLFDSESVIREERKAGECFLAAGDSVRYYNSVIKLVAECNKIKDTSAVNDCLALLTLHWNDLSMEQKSCCYAGRLCYCNYIDKASVNGLIDDYLNEVVDRSIVKWEVVAYSYYELGDYRNAHRSLSRYVAYGGEQDIAYQWVNGLVSEALGDYSSAAESYRKYITDDGNKNIDILASDTKFIEERAASEQKVITQRYTIIIVVLVCVIMLLVAGFITECLIRNCKARKLERQKHSAEMEKQKMKMKKTKEEAAAAIKMKLESEKMYEKALRQVTEFNSSLNL